MRYLSYFYIVIALCLAGCESTVMNSPYLSEDAELSTLYSSFSLRPKHLDPARSYSSNEANFTGQIYEPPFQYHYLKRPYTLIPLTATEMPNVRYFDSDDRELTLDETEQDIAYSVYEISIKEGILYQPHPAFVQDDNGGYSYHKLMIDELDNISELSDFKKQATRELIAEDYVYQIKRLAHPEIHSPILGLMGEYIVGLSDFAKELKNKGEKVNLRERDIAGVKVLDRYTYQIKVYGKYPQLRYWLAMPFFAPIPWEADAFYSQPSLIKKNITLDWYPVGTGPYHLTMNDPNSQMILEKNPNFHDDYYPKEGEDTDRLLLVDHGLKLPFIDKVVFTLEKENTSYWNKFLQGYYDVSGISSDSFEQAIQVGGSGDFGLSDAMKAKGIELKTAIGTSTYYIGFNMQDAVVGGGSEQAKKLRQAISIVIDYEEFISIFLNGRGIAAQGPIPPGIFGYESGQAGINSYVYQWGKHGPKRRSIAYARELLVEAGYPDGRDITTGEPLVLYFDVPGSGPDAKAQFDWLRKQFQKLNIQLVIRSTDYNRFQDKMRNGQAQIFQWGWNADYPDPENFLFLLYGPNGKVATGGENAANYQSNEFDLLFEKMRVMSNTKERKETINKMFAILTEDSPWVWGYHPKQFSLHHAWNKNVKPNLMANNTLKYRRIAPQQRQKLQQQWNQPILWPLGFVMIVFIALLLPAWLLYQRKKNTKIR
ncbi:MAG: ABC transporter substrate-binding protein [Gammaproteobacteria bacterium]|nr:ABC transporter substrate-binding protein [Gammaproteobacteria bacterium]